MCSYLRLGLLRGLFPVGLAIKIGKALLPSILNYLLTRNGIVYVGVGIEAEPIHCSKIPGLLGIKQASNPLVQVQNKAKCPLETSLMALCI